MGTNQKYEYECEIRDGVAWFKANSAKDARELAVDSYYLATGRRVYRREVYIAERTVLINNTVA